MNRSSKANGCRIAINCQQRRVGLGIILQSRKRTAPQSAFCFDVGQRQPQAFAFGSNFTQGRIQLRSSGNPSLIILATLRQNLIFHRRRSLSRVIKLTLFGSRELTVNTFGSWFSFSHQFHQPLRERPDRDQEIQRRMPSTCLMKSDQRRSVSPMFDFAGFDVTPARSLRIRRESRHVERGNQQSRRSKQTDDASPLLTAAKKASGASPVRSCTRRIASQPSRMTDYVGQIGQSQQDFLIPNP